MCTHYEGYFNKDDIVPLKSFLASHKTEKIFTDHYTKYSIDLLRNYSTEGNSARISGSNFNWDEINPGDWLLYNKQHIDELELQKYKFPDFSVLNSSKFRKLISFDNFIFYEKVEQNN